MECFRDFCLFLAQRVKFAGHLVPPRPQDPVAARLVICVRQFCGRMPATPGQAGWRIEEPLQQERLPVSIVAVLSRMTADSKTSFPEYPMPSGFRFFRRAPSQAAGARGNLPAR